MIATGGSGVPLRFGASCAPVDGVKLIVRLSYFLYEVLQKYTMSQAVQVTSCEQLAAFEGGMQ